MAKSAIYTVIMLLGLIFHPFHVSVCDIEHNAETKALEISQRVFMDDLETGMKAYFNLEAIDTYKPKDPAKLDSLIGAYLQAHLKIQVDGKKVEMSFLGSEIEEEARWCYLEIPDVASVQDITISNLTLLKTFDDQENIVHVKANGKLKSYRLNNDEKETTLSW